MDLQDFKNNIVNNDIDNFYIFAGEEVGIMNEYVKKIEQIKKCKIKRVNSFSEIKGELFHKSLFGTPNIYYVIDDKSALSDKELLSKLDSNSINGILILRFEKADNRLNIDKKYINNLIYFNTLSDEVLYYYIKRFFDVSVDNANILIKAVNNDYTRLMNEIDKLKILRDVKKSKNDDRLFEYAFKNGVIYCHTESVIFNFIDNIMDGNIEVAYELLKKSKQSGDEPLVILKLISTKIKNLLMFKGYNGKVPDKELNYYEIKNCQRWTKVWSVSELVNGLTLVSQIEQYIKTGVIEPSFSIDYLLLNIY